MADLPILGLYVCWRCNDHEVAVLPGADPPEYHDCGYGPLQWSGQAYWSNRRTWDEKPPKVAQHRKEDMPMRTRERIELNQIVDNPWQPRLAIDDQSADEMADSISELGLLQAPLGRRSPEDPKLIQLAHGHRRIAGVRRLRERVQWESHIDMDLEDLTDERMALIALAENQERRQLTQIEVLRAQQKAIEETELTETGLAEQLKIGRSTLSNNLRVLKLPDDVLQHVESGALTVGVAKEFLVLQSPTHAHVADMRAVVGRIVRRDGAPPDWRRRTVRKMISEAVSYNEKDWRPIGAPTSHKTGGGHKVATFDTDAFAHEFADSLHTVPATTATNAYGGADPAYEQSRVWTCEVREWSRQQSRATREANKEAEASGGGAKKAAGDAASQLGDVLKKDPVFMEIKAAREKRGPNRPVSDEEKEQLGTRAELRSVDPYGKEVWKKLAYAHPENEQEWRKNNGGGVPPWFPDLEECQRCIIGAAWAKPKHSYENKPVLVCTNKQHYWEKLALGEAAYRERLEDEKRDADAQDLDARLQVAHGLHGLDLNGVLLLAHALLSANPEIEWEHALGVPNQIWSYRSATAEWICDVLEVEGEARFNRWDARGTIVDPASLGKVGPDELRILVAALTVHHLRRAGKVDAVPRGTQIEIPEDAYELVGAS